MKIIIVWDHDNSDLFGAVVVNDDEVNDAHVRLNNIIDPESDLGLVVYPPDNLEDLINSLKESQCA